MKFVDNIGQIFIAFSAMVLSAFVISTAHAADLGGTVSNIATVSFEGTSTRVTFDTPPANFIVEAIRTPSTIDFFRYTPTAPDGISVNITGSDYAPTVDAAGNPVFQRIGPPITAGGQVLDFSGPVTISEATNYFAGELVIIRVTDLGQNGDPTSVERVSIILESGTGDLITLQLYESGPDTGIFFGYVTSTQAVVNTSDNLISIAADLPLTATYQDPFDATEISTDVAGVDPFGLIFDSATGALIDGATVTIINDATGQPADVFGIDGFSPYPSTIISGGTVTDASGFIYDLQPGEFVFPIMFPGTYRLVVDPPGSYQVPSAATPADIATLPGDPFIIVDASYLNAFVLDGTGDVNFDVPLDSVSELVVTKNTSSPTGAIGDFIRYDIAVENIGENAALISLRDLLPEGFRYQAGSARRDGVNINDPVIASDGTTLTFAAGLLQPNEATNITYVTEIAAGTASGDAINRAFVIDGSGNPISNTGQAAVFIREDLLRSRLTIIGRVIINGCDPKDDWPREITNELGLEGARLYMETGAYVTTDEDGLFHFEDVTPRTHVVQLDTASLPEGLKPVVCEENSRYAGSAISKFVDAKGGSVWRANFYVEGDISKIEATTEKATAVQNRNTEYLKFDKEWLNLQDPEAAFAYPEAGTTPNNRSVNIGVKHPPNQRVKLLLNGADIPGTNFAGRDVSLMRHAAITRWRGVDIADGENIFTAIILDEDKNEIGRLIRRIDFISSAEKAVFMAEQSRLIVDGKNPSVIALRVTDAGGRPVHAGRLINVEIDPPYRGNEVALLESRLPITEKLSARSSVAVGDDGIAKVEIAPTLRSGKAKIELLFDDGRREQFSVYLKPELRDWIVVGLAEGEASFDKVNNAGVTTRARDLDGRGRIAGFAKGTIKGDWLITIAGDTANERGDEDTELFDVIDPDARYPLYGDRSNQQFEAQSRYPVYFKAEKGSFQTLFGDYDTGLNESTLGKYSRRLSGLQTVYEGDRFTFTGFAAETNQAFAKDEIAADGTSGPFRLTVNPIVRNSEKIYVEARDRFRPDIVTSTLPLSRYIDYDIDFVTGELLLRLPVPAANDQFNYNVIVAEYESSAPVDRNITAGGRGTFKFLRDRAQIGVTGIYESGRPDALDGESTLAAVDLRVDVTDTTRLKLEYGKSWRDTATGEENGNAKFAEVEHVSKNVTARAYYQETDPGFGLNQQSSGASGVRRVGGEASVRIDESTSERTGRRQERFVDAKVYYEENLATGADRTVSEVALRQESDATSGSLGLRRVVENPATGDKRESILATAQVRQSFEKLGLTLLASRDQPISSKGDSNFFPKRTSVGLEQKLGEKITLSVNHELQESDTVSSANTIVGVTVEPWDGARITASADKVTQESGQRLGATFGVDQQVKIDEKWSASFGVSRRQELDSDGTISQVDDIVPDKPVSPLENNQNFTSAFVGAGFRSELTTGSARLEMRKSQVNNRYAVIAGAAREVNEDLSFAGAGRVQFDENRTAADERTIDARLGVAWRPRGEGLVAFNRFDIKQHIVEGEINSWKAVNNLAINAMIDERWQVSVNHGIKYSALDTSDATFTGFTQLAGIETRYDIFANVDIGLHGSILYSHNASNFEYSYGPSIGITPADNIWLSLGWNFAGFEDDDFTGANYSRNGPYLKLRIKFDQNTASGLLNSISPDRD